MAETAAGKMVSIFNVKAIPTTPLRSGLSCSRTDPDLITLAISQAVLEIRSLVSTRVNHVTQFLNLLLSPTYTTAETTMLYWPKRMVWWK